MGHGESEQLIVIVTDRRDVWWATPKDEMEIWAEPQDGVESKDKWTTKGQVHTAPREMCAPTKAKPFLRKVDRADFVRDVTYVSGPDN